MSVELSEAFILATQMNKELPGKKIKSYLLTNHERLQKDRFINQNIEDFDRLVGGTVSSARSRGIVIRTELDNSMNLLLARARPLRFPIV